MTKYGEELLVKFQLIPSLDVPWQADSKWFGEGKMDIDDCFVRISVIDNGPGLSSSQIDNLESHWIEFVAPELQDGQGYGLEVWVANKIAKMHGGKMAVYSAGRRKGAAFYIDLPLQCSSPPSRALSAGPRK